ncbi:MAG: glycosyltransferase [Verrucomicrobiae bacterium]|nr:glycosyltransferase [Verrucomicrobiae bacterium]
MTLSVIIPVRNGGPKFRRCLETVTAAKPPPHEIIVVADNPTDDSASLAESFGAKVIRLAQNSGPARARNIGAHAANGAVLVFLDADVSIAPDTLAQITAAFEREPTLTAVFGSYDDAPAEVNFLSQYKNLFHHYIHQTAREEASTFWAGCGAVRRETFLALDGFDESYRQPSIEDIELGYRLRRAGHQIRLIKTLQVKHLKRWTASSLIYADFWLRAVPWSALILRERRMPNDLNLTWKARLAVVFGWATLVSLVAKQWWMAATMLAAMLATHAGLLRFFLAKRGWLFTLKAVPWLWLHNIYSGLGFVVGALRYWLR